MNTISDPGNRTVSRSLTYCPERDSVTLCRQCNLVQAG